MSTYNFKVEQGVRKQISYMERPVLSKGHNIISEKARIKWSFEKRPFQMRTLGGLFEQCVSFDTTTKQIKQSDEALPYIDKTIQASNWMI